MSILSLHVMIVMRMTEPKTDVEEWMQYYDEEDEQWMNWFFDKRGESEDDDRGTQELYPRCTMRSCSG